MALKNSIYPIRMALFNSVNLVNGTFVAFNLALPHACFMIRLLNRSNRFVYVSYDGVNYHDGVFPEEQLTLPWQQFSQPNGKIALMKEGTRVYLTGNPVGANGFIYLCGYYQEYL